MKLYIVMEEDGFLGTSIIGIFADKNKADNFASNMSPAWVEEVESSERLPIELI